MKNKKRLILIILIAVAAACVIAFFVYQVLKNKERTAAVNTSSDAGYTDSGSSDSDSDSYMKANVNGTVYDYNTNLKNILFLGIDNTDEVEAKTPGYAGQSDCIILLSMDTETKKTKLLEISRDSMTEIKIYGANGGYIGTDIGQITLQFAYGDGKEKSCLLTKEAVSKLLFSIPIRSYMSLDISGIAPIIDAMGGLLITLEEDWTWIDPAFAKGASLTMDGATTTKFVRSRDTSVTDSNEDRMKRQTAFLRAFISRIQNGGISYKTLLDAAGSYLVTDLQDDEISALTSYNVDDEIERVPGQTVMGEKYAEFNVDKDGLYKILLQMMYNPEKAGK